MKRSLAIVGALVLAATTPAGNLISDGGFEIGDEYSPQFTGSPWTTQYGYATNNNRFSGDLGSIWHEGNMRVMDLANNPSTGHTSWDPVTASEGTYFLAVNGATQQTDRPFVLSQDFTYSGSDPLVVSFDSVNLFKSGGLDEASTLEVFLDGVSLGTTNTYADNLWRTATFTSMAGQGSTHTVMIVADTTQAIGNDFGLDDVMVEAVPEPSTTIGMAVAFLYLRRRMNARKVKSGWRADGPGSGGWRAR